MQPTDHPQTSHTTIQLPFQPYFHCINTSYHQIFHCHSTFRQLQLETTHLPYIAATSPRNKFVNSTKHHTTTSNHHNPPYHLIQHFTSILIPDQNAYLIGHQLQTITTFSSSQLNADLRKHHNLLTKPNLSTTSNTVRSCDVPITNFSTSKQPLFNPIQHPFNQATRTTKNRKSL